jgi:predicted RND superfamily exporter protein
VQNFKLDASADSLILENDKDLRYHRATDKTYGTEDFLIITYTPFDELLSERSLQGLQGLKMDLEELERIESVVSILDVPLLASPKIKISDLEEDSRTLSTPGLDKKLAKKETFCAHNLLKFKRLFCQTAPHYRRPRHIMSINLIKFG